MKACSQDNSSGEWFRDWFGDDYLHVYRHRDGTEAERFTSKWPVWERLPKRSRVLDLGCGTGRYSFAIARLGLPVIGIDLSKELLEHTARNDTCNPNVRFIRADIRHLPFNGLKEPIFGLVVSLFTSFGYFEEDTEHLRLLKEVAQVMLPGGCLVLDLPNSADVKESVARCSNRVRIDGCCRIIEKYQIDNVRRRVEKSIEIEKSGEIRSYKESVRLFEPDELFQMTSDAGFSPISRLWGDYTGGEFKQSCPRMVYFGYRFG